MERAEEQPSKLLKKLDLIFIPSSLIRAWHTVHKEDAREFTEKDYMSMGEFIYSVEKIASFLGVTILEAGRLAAYSVVAYHLINNS